MRGGVRATVNGVEGWLHPNGSFVPFGIKSPEHLAKLRATGISSPLYPRCGMTKRNGTPCRYGAMFGTGRCAWHQPPGWLAELRRRAEASGDAKLMAVVLRRENRARLKAAWRKDRWVPGRTVIVNDKTKALMVEVATAAGLSPDRISPATLDWLAWQCRKQVERRAARTLVQVRDDLAAKVRADGPMPEDWGCVIAKPVPSAHCWVQPGAVEG